MGADGAQVAFLFNNGGPAQSVSAVQELNETLQPGRDYTLRVAVGKFDPSQPYSPSTYGGYRIELLAGDTVIASDSDTQDPPSLTFVDAVAVASATNLPRSLVGQPLSIRLTISAVAAQRSTHFDNVRLTWAPSSEQIPPQVALTSPRAGSTFFTKTDVLITAEASDDDGTVSAVRLYDGDRLLTTLTRAPYSYLWRASSAGEYRLRAEAEDDQGLVTRSAVVPISVLRAGAAVPIGVGNASFEQPALADGIVQNDAGIADWTFTGTAQTFRGVFNPPAGSYPEAAGQGTPIGAVGSQVAFLFNNGGPAEQVSAVQQLTETLQPDRDYTLRVAIGKFDPTQPYATSSYGGYRIQLLAGDTVIAEDSDTQDPTELTFVDATAMVQAARIRSSLLGQPLSIRLGISSREAQRSTHFDNVRLSWSQAAGSPEPE